MKKSLPCLSLLAAVCFAIAAIADPTPALPNNSPQALVAPPAEAQPMAAGDQLLAQAVSQLQRRTSVTAKLRHQLAIGGQQLYGVGSYWQQGSGEDLKVRLELQIAGQDAQLLQVCDSRYAWVDRKLPTGRNVTRINLRQLRADPSLSGGNLSDIKPGEANWSSTQSELTQFTGGLPAMLNGLSDNFAFLPPQAMRLAIEPPLASESTNLPVFAVVGHWKPEKLAAIVTKAQAAELDAPQSATADAKRGKKALPERIPQEVLLLVGQADLFPYRIEYRRLETPQLARGGDGPAIPYQLSVHPMVVLELSNVVFDAPIESGQFDYSPANPDWVDQTTAVIGTLRQQHQADVAVRPDEKKGKSSRQ